MFEELLKKTFELSENEISIYSILQSLGPQPASVIAKKIGCARTSAYSALERMTNKGIVFSMITSHARCFCAVERSQLQQKLHTKKREHHDSIAEIEQIIEELTTSKAKSAHLEKHTPKIEFFCGVSGLSMLNNKGPIYGYGNFAAHKKALNDITCNAFLVDTSSKPLECKNKNVHVKHNFEQKKSSWNVLVNKESIVFYSPTTTKIGVQVSDEQIAQKQQEVLHALWSRL